MVKFKIAFICIRTKLGLRLEVNMIRVEALSSAHDKFEAEG